MTVNSDLDLIIDAAALESRPGHRIYVIGPYAKRISFLSQQYRALNLVFALRKKGLIEPRSRVAIIGGGLAGVTAASALRGYNNEVVLFEKKSALLARQRATTQRHIFPALNRWPDLEACTLSTSVPFLHWPAGSCYDVLTWVEHDFNALRKEKGTPIIVLKEHEVISISEPDKRKKMSLICRPRYDNKNFDVVIIATGLSDERDLETYSTPDYWSDDNIENKRNSGRYRRFLISGCGDGGLIDALRISYNFEFGRLAFNVAKSLDGSQLCRDIQEFEKKIEGVKIIERSCLEYKNFAQQISDDKRLSRTRKLLEGAQVKMAGLVILSDIAANDPYAANAAPIHKLMVAYAHNENIVSFKKCSLTFEHKTDGVVEYQLGDERFNEKDSYAIVRHGAEPYYGSLLTLVEIKALSEPKRVLSKFNHEPVWSDGDYNVPKPWACPVKEKQLYASQIEARAEAALNYIGLQATVMASKDGMFLEVYSKSSKIPERLFGVKTRHFALKPSGDFHGL